MSPPQNVAGQNVEPQNVAVQNVAILFSDFVCVVQCVLKLCAMLCAKRQKEQENQRVDAQGMNPLLGFPQILHEICDSLRSPLT